MLLKVYTGKCSEDGVDREGCKFQGMGHHFPVRSIQLG